MANITPDHICPTCYHLLSPYCPAVCDESMTIIDFIEAALTLCDEWENGDRLPPDENDVPELLEPLGMFEQELRDLDMSNESEGDQAAAQDALMLLASLKVRIEAIASVPLKGDRDV